MEKSKKIFLLLTFLIAPIFLVGFLPQTALAATDNSALIAQLQQEIQSLIRQIIALLQQQIQTAQHINLHPISNSKTATLTVTATGVSAYVSINNGIQFVYTSPITLNNGDKYLVTAGTGNSTNKCSGTASSGGNYTCNISINSY